MYTAHTRTHRRAHSLKHNWTHTDTLIHIRLHTDTSIQKYTHKQLLNTQATSDINELIAFKFTFYIYY